MKWHKPPALWRALKPASRAMRAEPTPDEAMLWEHIRDRRLDGLKFRRQHVIGRFIADFYCSSAHLVVEIDGGIHLQQGAKDAARDEFMQTLGLRVLRVSSEDVFRDIEQVLAAIGKVASPPAFGHPLSAGGEGDGG